jgi:RsiW-degrading membrane proteinase PrsW (M82 family)
MSLVGGSEMLEDPSLKIRRVLVFFFILSLLVVGAYTLDAPSAFLFALIPLSYTVPAFIWLDRLEPEPRAMRWNAFLWGGGVAALVAGIANGVTEVSFGTAAALVISAPLVEETMKTLGILGAAKRNQIDTPLDGVVYAGYVGLGFATVENVMYFGQAITDGDLGPMFVVRGLLSPFSHPFFTLWAGLAIGKAVKRGSSRKTAALRGLLLSMALHALWNAASLHAVFALLLFGQVALFVVVGWRLQRMRHAEIVRVRHHLPKLAFVYNVSPVELEVYGDLRATQRLRSKLTRKERSAFDARRVFITKRALQEEQV